MKTNIFYLNIAAVISIGVAILMSTCRSSLAASVAHPLGEANYLVQGLRSNTLVAGKTTALRLFTQPVSISSIDHINVRISCPDGSRATLSWGRNDFVAIPSSSLGPSVVVRIFGSSLPIVGAYSHEADLVGQSGQVLASYSHVFQLLPTKDVLIAIDRIWAGVVNPGTPQEIQAAHDAMQRLASVWPIRDGISTLDGDRTAGLRYVINNNPSGSPCQDCHICPFVSNWLDRPAGYDSISAVVVFRFQDPGGNCGGNGGKNTDNCSGHAVGVASIVCNGPLAGAWGQEIGHGYGLEPLEDPHHNHNPNVQAHHSKDQTIEAMDAELGFDIQLNQPFQSPMYDNMYQATCGCPNDRTCYNSWDWEYLRQQFVNLNSTGPTTNCFDGAPIFFVPSQYGTVRGAYNAAPGCSNIIRIATGTHHEAPINFNLNKRVRLESQGGPVTITR